MPHTPAKPCLLPLRTLPLVEHWDCHGCGRCCRGGGIPLDLEDRERLGRQGWQQRADFAGLPIIVRQGFWSKSYRLGSRSDGSCVFLTPGLRCRIHEEYGEAAKPRVCRDFPWLLVPLEDFCYLSVRRSCPSAAAESGRPLDSQRDDVCRFGESHPVTAGRAAPAVTAGHQRSWNDARRVLETLERLMLDGRYPLVRRLVHGLQCCSLLEASQLGSLDSPRFGSLMKMLEDSAAEQAAGWFQNRTEPGGAAGLLFRRTAAEYLFLHPGLVLDGSWRQRWRLARVMLAVSRGKGQVPAAAANFPGASFARLNEPLGHLPEAVLRPLVRYYETSVVSRQYAILGRTHWSIVESFRALALTYSVALWLLRFRCPQQAPQVEAVVDVVGAIERGQGHAPLFGTAHRRRVQTLAHLGELPRLVVWHAR